MVIGQNHRQKFCSPTALRSPYWAWLIFSCSPSARCYIFIQEKNPGKQFKKTWKGEREWRLSKLPMGVGKAPEKCIHVEVIGVKGATALENSPWTEGAAWKPKDLWNAGSFQQLNIWWSASAKCSQGQCRGSKVLLVRSRWAGQGTGSSAGCRARAGQAWEVLLFWVQTF